MSQSLKTFFVHLTLVALLGMGLEFEAQAGFCNWTLKNPNSHDHQVDKDVLEALQQHGNKRLKIFFEFKHRKPVEEPQSGLVLAVQNPPRVVPPLQEQIFRLASQFSLANLGAAEFVTTDSIQILLKGRVQSFRKFLSFLVSSELADQVALGSVDFVHAGIKARPTGLVGTRPDIENPQYRVPPDSLPHGLASGVAATPEVAESINLERAKEIARAINTFGLRLFGEALKAEDANKDYVLSPMSVFGAMTMLTMAAKGSSLEELKKLLTLRLSGDANAAVELSTYLGSHNWALKRVSEKSPNTRFEEAQSIWAAGDIKLNPQYVALNQRASDADVRTIDFTSGAEKIINDWINGKTDHLIPHLFDDHTFDAETRLVLVNALFFRGKWASVFEKESTFDAQFTTAQGTTKKVKMMRKSVGAYHYTQNENYSAIELPFEGDRLSMVFVLPQNPTEFTAVASSLKPDEVFAALDRANIATASVQIPRFEVKSRRELVQDISALGARGIFEDAANFSGMTSDGESLKVSRIIHEARLIVDEDGGAGGAATGIVMKRTTAIRPPSFSFVANRPFQVFVRLKETNTNVFSAVIRDPMEPTVSSQGTKK